MKINQFGHLAFNCKNQQKSVAFYRDILGFEEKFSFMYSDFIEIVKNSGYKVPSLFLKMLEKRKDRTWLTYLEAADGIYIELFDQMGAFLMHKAKAIHFNYQHFAIIVDDIEQTKADLIAGNVGIDTDISFGPDFTYQMWIHDPDGNKIEIMQYTDESFQVVGKH